MTKQELGTILSELDLLRKRGKLKLDYFKYEFTLDGFRIIDEEHGLFELSTSYFCEGTIVKNLTTLSYRLISDLIIDLNLIYN